MGSDSKKGNNSDVAFSLTVVLGFAWLFYGIILIPIYCRDVARAETDYLSAEAVVISFGGQDPLPRRYTQYNQNYNCRFVDHNGITRTGVFGWSSEEKSKYRRGDTVTIYYKTDFNDGDEVWCVVFSSPNPAYYFWPWVFLLITLIIHIQMRIQRKKRYG